MNVLEIFEQWRTISGFPNYQVSNVGRVMNIKTGRIKQPTIDANGYFYMNLHHNDRVKIHILGAQEFLQKPIGEKLMIDHIDRNRLNNCVSNLRYVSQSQNNMNAGKVLKDTSSKYKGVCWNVAKLRWSSQIKINGKKKHLGYFNNEDDAARRYNEEAVELFGEHACLNEVLPAQEGWESGQVKRACSSKHKGIGWRKDKNKWVARIKINGLYKHLGYFSNEMEAVEAYNKKARELEAELEIDV